jgi:uncharacterized membrane protein YcgQ (UPF0703/DUF1980 family)
MLKKILTIAILTLLTSVSHAGQLLDWFEAGIARLDRPLDSTLQFYRTEGLVLIDYDADYVAYSVNASRLNSNEKKEIGLVEAQKTFVLKFNSCPGQHTLRGNINIVTVKLKTEDYSKVMQEILDTISRFDNNRTYTKGTFGKSKNTTNQIFMSWKKSDGTLIELQINQNPPHQLVAVAAKSCK